MRLDRESLAKATLYACAPLVLLLAAVGAVRSYSPVPFWDMWHGYLHFYQLVTEGHWKEWWALHNEHRIVLARLLFWIDLALFDGNQIVLLAANYALAFGAFLTWRAILRERAGPDAPPLPLRLVTLLVLMALFSWMQWENFSWGFQSQFFLAQWLPLLALWLLYRATVAQPDAARDFALACLTGVLCLGTMASGVIALPVMVALAIVLRMGWRRVGVLALLAAVCLALYFHGYQSTPGHGSVREALVRQPVALLQYVLLYLGGPFHQLAGTSSLVLGQLAGGVLVVLAAARAWVALRAPRDHALELAVLAYLLYLGGTALGTGGGRLIFGLQQATASRYTTPALMAWMGVIALYLPPLLRALGQWRHIVVWPLIILALALTAHQWKARKSQRDTLFERDVAALGLELRVRDDQQIRFVHFNIDWALAATERAVRDNWSVFGRERFRDAGAAIGQPAGPLAAAACRAVLVEAAPVPLDPRWVRISGWIGVAAGENEIDRVRLVAPDGTVAGQALAGELRKRPGPDVGQGPDSRPFKGYLLASQAYAPLRLAAAGATPCTVQPRPLPRPPFSVQAAASRSPVVPPAAVLANEGFAGADFQRTQVAGFRVIGSHVTGDADMGTLRLRLKRGDTLHLRTGPVTAHQRYRIDDAPGFAGLLPVAQDWVAIVFDHPDLPAEFSLTLTDGGTGWGEWSAIAVKDGP